VGNRLEVGGFAGVGLGDVGTDEGVSGPTPVMNRIRVAEAARDPAAAWMTGGSFPEGKKEGVRPVRYDSGTLSARCHFACHADGELLGGLLEGDSYCRVNLAVL
jgi:hypothetical protein